MNKDKNVKKISDEEAKFLAALQKKDNNPIDNVIGMMLKSDAKSCKLASTRLSQIEEKKSAKSSFGTADESLTCDSND